jgi:serine/threonine-protein kinase
MSARHVPPGAVPGALLGGKYRLDSMIGYGGMGSVWAALHVGIEQRVAVKIVSPEYARQPDIRRRFDAEAKASVRLKSRYVVHVYDNGELDDGTPFLVMEYLDGESLAGRIRRAGPMPVVDCAHVLVHVGKALQKAHEQAIVHRDIKPENIFIARSSDEDGYLAKVLDFGIAKITPTGGQSSTRTGALLGTPMYMSPEQARGLRTIDYRTDLYSLGLVAFAMLTGRPAFSSDSYGDLILQICTQPLPDILPLAPWAPPAVDAWFRRASAREPGERFTSAQELVDAFCAVVGIPGGAAALGGPIGVAPAPWQVTGATGAPPLAPSPVAYPVSYPRAPVATATALGATAATVPRRSTGAIVAVAFVGFLVLGGGVAAFALRANPGRRLPSAPEGSVRSPVASQPTPPGPLTAVSTTGLAPPPSASAGEPFAATSPSGTTVSASTAVTIGQPPSAVPRTPPPIHPPPPGTARPPSPPSVPNIGF